MKIPRVVYSFLIMGIAVAAIGAVVAQNANAARGGDSAPKPTPSATEAPKLTILNLVNGAATASNDDGNENEGGDHQSNPPVQPTPGSGNANGLTGQHASRENESEGSGRGSGQTPTPVVQPTPVPGSITITGAITGGTIVVNGQTITVNQNTKIEGRLTPGAQLQIEAVQQADGSLLALVIRAPYASQGGQDDQNENEGEHRGTPAPTGTPVPTATPGPSPTPGPTAATVSYAGVVQPILNTYCVGCHGGTAGVTLSSYSTTINTVTPGNAASSRLYLKVSTGHGGLATAQIQSIANWINQGALNN